MQISQSWLGVDCFAALKEVGFVHAGTYLAVRSARARGILKGN
jgi:hypothetical protein